MPDIIQRVWENLIERTEGPMNLRFFIQPGMSLIFAILAAIRDAKTGQIPYLWRFAFKKDERDIIKKESWKDVGKIFIIGVSLDIVYQLIVIFKLKTETQFYPLESVIVAICLALLPYMLFRGPVNRVMRIFVKKEN